MKNKTHRMRTAVGLVAVLLVLLAVPAFAAEEGTGADPRFYETFWSLLPPVVAIALALITKEVYSSLFLGILTGGLLWSGFAFEGTITHVFQDGIVSVLANSYNVGILAFLVILGAMVCLMNRAGGSAAFGRWAQKNIKTRAGAQLATIVLGILIFIDDYFNCLTVGSVMRPVTDSHQVSRAKLAYLIDATAAPVCIIAPISSWAAAVSGFVDDGSGLALFIRAIPYNYYALLTIVMMVGLVVMKADFGPMDRSILKGVALEDGTIHGGCSGSNSGSGSKCGQYRGHHSLCAGPHPGGTRRTFSAGQLFRQDAPRPRGQRPGNASGSDGRAGAADGGKSEGRGSKARCVRELPLLFPRQLYSPCKR